MLNDGDFVVLEYRPAPHDVQRAIPGVSEYFAIDTICCENTHLKVRCSPGTRVTPGKGEEGKNSQRGQRGHTSSGAWGWTW